MLNARPLHALPAVMLSLVALSCQEHGYRTEVTTGPQGQTQVHRVPIAEAAPAPTTVHARDAELTDVEALWPRLTPDDRSKVAAMARELAARRSAP